MRTLSAALTAEQKKLTARPYVEAKVYDFEQGLQRLNWTRLYTGGESDKHHGIAFDGQGSMHRIRFSGTNVLYRQKITNPGPASDYTSWVQVSANAHGPCAIAACGAKVYIFYRKDDNTIRKYYSHNYGVDWTDDLLSSYANATSMAAAWWGTGDIVVCFIANGIIADGELNAIVLDTSTQGKAEYTDSEPGNHPLLGVYGIGATFATGPEKMCVIFAARQQATPYNFYALYRTELEPNGGYNWLAWDHFITVPDGEDINYQYPDIHLPASPQAYEWFQMTAVEVFAGTTAYSRPLRFQAVRASEFSEMAFTEPKPFLNISSIYGLRLATTADYWWLSRPDGVWRAPRAAGTALDLTADIVELNQRIPGELTIELDNHSGKYASPGEGDIAKLKKRSEVFLQLGYRTSPSAWVMNTVYAEGAIIIPTSSNLTGYFYECTTAGSSHATIEPTWPTTLGDTVVDNTVTWTCHYSAEVSPAGVYWIDEWEYQSAPNQSLFVLHCIDGGGLATKWLSRTQLRWNDTAVAPKVAWQLIKALLCRWGICLVNAAARSTAITSLQPEVIVNPGQAGAGAVSGLLAMVPDLLNYQKWHSDIGYIIATTREPKTTDASSYEYKNAAGYHHILEGNYHQAIPVSQARAKGRAADESSVIESAFDWDLLGLAIDNFQPDYDPNLETATRTQERADAILRKSALGAEGGQITVPVNCGQELYDVITVTDERCGIAAALYRVLAIEVDYSPRQARYSQRLTLASR